MECTENSLSERLVGHAHTWWGLRDSQGLPVVHVEPAAQTVGPVYPEPEKELSEQLEHFFYSMLTSALSIERLSRSRRRARACRGPGR